MQGVVSARSLVRIILEQNNGNVSVTSRILWCSRKCVRRARDGTLEDESRRPKSISSSQTPSDLENLVLLERKQTRYGRKRLAKKKVFSLYTNRNLIYSKLSAWNIYFKYSQ